MRAGPVLFLDLATTTGWCEGPPGDRPKSGTIRLAPDGAPPAAVFAGMMRFLADRFRLTRYRLIAYEAPMDPRHMKTNANTVRKLIGLPAIVEGLAYETGHWSIREARVDAIRMSLLGFRPGKGEGKTAVIAAIEALGFNPRDDNEADAIAGWLYATKVIAGA